jgi:hypothetical protein
VRGVRLDSAVPSRLKVGDVLRIGGVLSEPLPGDLSENDILVGAWTRQPDTEFSGGWTKLEDRHRFSVNLTFRRSGQYSVGVWVPSTGLRAMFGRILVE